MHLSGSPDGSHRSARQGCGVLETVGRGVGEGTGWAGEAVGLGGQVGCELGLGTSGDGDGEGGGGGDGVAAPDGAGLRGVGWAPTGRGLAGNGSGLGRVGTGVGSEASDCCKLSSTRGVLFGTPESSEVMHESSGASAAAYRLLAAPLIRQRSRPNSSKCAPQLPLPIRSGPLRG